MTDWWQYQGNLACTDEQINCRWMVTAGCLPALFNEVSRFILNSAKTFHALQNLALHQQQACLSRWRAQRLMGLSSSGSDSPRYSCMNDTCNTWRVFLSGEIYTFPKISLLWLKWHCEIKLNLFLAAVWPYSHANNLGTLNSELIVIYENPTGNLESPICHFRS